MAKNKNSVALIGTVGGDPTCKTLQDGTMVARFSLATSEGGYKRQDGTDVPEVTQWHNIVAWRKLAEIISKYVRKGNKLAVDGKITYGKYQKQGVECLSVDIVASDIVLMSAPQQNGLQTAQTAPQSPQAQQVGSWRPPVPNWQQAQNVTAQGQPMQPYPEMGPSYNDPYPF